MLILFQVRETVCFINVKSIQTILDVEYQVAKWLYTIIFACKITNNVC